MTGNDIEQKKRKLLFRGSIFALVLIGLIAVIGKESDPDHSIVC